MVVVVGFVVVVEATPPVVAVVEGDGAAVVAVDVEELEEGVWSWPRRSTVTITKSPSRITARSTGNRCPERWGFCASGSKGSSTPVSLPTSERISKHSRPAGRRPYTVAGSHSREPGRCSSVGRAGDL